MEEYFDLRKPIIYCGDPVRELPEGYTAFGDRYSCFRKGVGVGVHTVDNKTRRKLMEKPYTPKEEKIFCGKDENDMTDEYTRLGTPKECLSKGVGVGIFKIPGRKRKKMRKNGKDYLPHVPVKEVFSNFAKALGIKNVDKKNRETINKEIMKRIEILDDYFSTLYVL